MTPIVFLGDEAAAAGFRLIGVAVRIARSGRESEDFQAARRDAALLLVDARCAARLPPRLLAEAQSAAHPLLQLVSLDGSPPPALDPASRARRLLGLGS